MLTEEERAELLASLRRESDAGRLPSFEVLSKVLEGKPTFAAWDRLVRALVEVPAELIEPVTRWLDDDLRGWPDHLRLMPDAWWDDLIDGTRSWSALARLRLVGLRFDVEIPPEDAHRLAVHPAGTCFVVAGVSDPNRAGGEVTLHGMAEVRCPPRVLLSGRDYGGDADHVCFGPDGDLVAAAIRHDSSERELLMWNAVTGEHLWQRRSKQPNDSWIQSVVFCGEARSVAWCDGGERVLVLDAADGRTVGELPHAARVLAMRSDGPGRRLATLVADGTVRVWDVAHATTLASTEVVLGRASRIGIVWAGDGDAFAVCVGVHWTTWSLAGATLQQIDSGTLEHPRGAEGPTLRCPAAHPTAVWDAKNALTEMRLASDGAHAHTLSIETQVWAEACPGGMFVVGNVPGLGAGQWRKFKAEFGFEPAAAEPGEQSVAIWWWNADGEWPSLKGKLQKLSPFERRLRRLRTLVGAVVGRDLDAVHYYVAVERADVNAGRPLIAAAAMCGEAKSVKGAETAIVRYLLDHGADARLGDERGTTPLLSLLLGSPPPTVRDTVMEWLLAAGADPYAEMSVKPEERYREAYHCVVWAARNGITNLLRRLDRFPPQALVATAAEDRLDALRLMLGRGADINSANEFGVTVLHAAVGHQREGLVAELVDRGADLTRRNERGETALHVAARWGHLAIARRLVEAGADPNARTDEGDTPLTVARNQLAAQSGRTDQWGTDIIRKCGEVIAFLEPLR